MGAEATLGVLTLNLCNPSKQRAKLLLEWLGERREQVLVLTETSDGAGTQLIVERLRSAGWTVSDPEPSGGERGVLVASRVVIGDRRAPIVSYLPERVAAISVGDLEVIGVYAPSRDESAEKVARKRRFLAELLTVIGTRRSGETVLIGDLNIVERGSRASGGVFREWEYELYEELPELGWLDAYRSLHPDRVELSWVDGEGHGYRFDHAFVSAELGGRVGTCEYIHETRESELSDHSAMVLELTETPHQLLEADLSLAAGPPSLF